MFTMNVPKAYWGDAVLSAAYLINRMPLKTLGFKSLLEILHGTNSYTIPPKVFGCVCFVHRSVGKLDPRALKCVFVGYSVTQKGYKCYHPPTRKFFVSMDVTFRELQPYLSPYQSPLQGENKEEEATPSTHCAPIQVFNLITSDEGETHQSGRLDRLDLKTYTRRNKADKTIEHVLPSQVPDLNSVPVDQSG